ncbi:MAG: hypothetical protein CMH13_11090 [Martelella sp.]|uniref:tyrosine-type recombinase/integrase n=2 Tax=unclassified Martelella TaxID=2629616 RepID=UPI000C3A5EDE|nr:hypothetical protein [Martelella sp.]MAU21064.1 hypothetical protein [Martelella sp.]
MRKNTPKIKYVSWRNGRPRFSPSPTLRQRGYQPHDLRREDGEWMTAGEALDWSRAFEREAAALKSAVDKRRNRRPAPPPKPVSFYTVEQLLRDFEMSQAFRDRAQNTQRDYRQKIRSIERHLPDAWKAEAEALTQPICFGMYDELRGKTGLPTANAAMRILGIAFSWGMSRGKLPAVTVNPAHKLKLKKEEPRVRAGEREEIEHLIATADKLNRPEIGDMIALGVWSGQRQGDRLAYQVAGRGNGRVMLRQSKTKALVDIREFSELKKRLDAAQARRKLAKVVSSHVILDERSWTPFKPDHYRHVYDEVRRHAAKTMRSCATLRDQDLRDTAVTWLFRAGCTIGEICAITGHSLQTATQILEHYFARHPELADSAIDKVELWWTRGD